MPSAEYQSKMKSLGPGTVKAETEDRRSEIKERMRRERSERWSIVNMADAAVLGAADTLTLGFMDEIGAGLDSVFKGKDYDDALQEQRAFFEVSQEQNPLSLLSGQLAGGLAPFLGWGGRSVSAMTASGAVYGGLYGLGSDEGGITERLDGALDGAGYGALGGFVLSTAIIPLVSKGSRKALSVMRRGKTPEITADDLKFTDDLVDNAQTTAPQPLSANQIAGKLADPDAMASKLLDEFEPGTLVSARELLGDPQAAMKAIEKRLGKMSDEEAVALVRQIDEAEKTGKLATNPHYRSILRIAATADELDPEKAATVGEIMEYATRALAKKAGIGPKTLDSIEKKVDEEIKKGLSIKDTEAAYDKARDAEVTARVQQINMFLQAGRMAAAREKILPRVLAGEEGAREELVKKVADAAYHYTLARGVLSSAGRTLGVLSHGTKSRNIEITEQLSREAIQARIAESIKEMGDEGLKDLMKRVGRMDLTEEVIDTLLDPKEAKAFTVWQRTIGTLSQALRSTGLTQMTAAINVVGALSNDFFRNELGKGKAIKNLMKAGRVTEAEALRFERMAARAVYWKAHREGLKAFMNRVKWEYWSDVERIAAVGWGPGKVAAKARLKRETMLQNGFVLNQTREFADAPRLNIQNTDAFNEYVGELKRDGGALGSIAYHIERARAVVANTTDALLGSQIKTFTAAPDDWGREFVRFKETYVQATRFAVQEAQKLNLNPKQFSAYVQARAKDLAEMPNSEILDRVESSFMQTGDLNDEAAFLRDLHKMANDEAEQVLFLDGPQTKAGQRVAGVLNLDKIGLIFPYVNTPIRLFEQGVVTYGPFGKFTKEIKKIIEKGGVEAELAKARVEVGTQIFSVGVFAGLTGAITASNGGFQNSANLDAGPPMRLNLPGGGFIEVSRFDPFSFTVAMGSIIGQALRQGWDESADYEMAEVIRGALSTAVTGAYESILSKAYMKTAQETLEAFSDAQNGDWSGFEKILQNGAVRLIPFSGVSRQINDTFRDSAAESVGWADAMLRAIPGMGWGLAPRIDPLGDEVKPREIGFNFGNANLTEGRPISPVKQQLRELGIDINTLRKSDPDGFDLTSEELSEVRRIRGKEALNEDGLTMEEALGSLFADPWFQTLRRKEDKRKAVVETMAEFNKPAWEILEQRSPTYAGKKAYNKSLQDYIAMNLETRQAERLAERDVQALGLPLE